MRPRLSALTACAALGMLAVKAHAAELESPSALPISLELRGCEALDQAELFKLLVIEFRTLNVRPSTPPELVRVICGRERATVTLDESPSANEVDLLATRKAAWPRLLALSISEIVIEARARVPLEAPQGAPAPVTSGRSAPPLRSASDARWRFFSSLLVRRALRTRAFLAGPELGAASALWRHFSVAADVRIELGQKNTELARVDWFSASAAAVALLDSNVGPWDFAAGPGFRVGYLRLSPSVRQENAVGHDLSGVWAGPELVGRVRYDVGAHWFALLSADGGIVTAPVRGLVNGEQRLIDTGGAWISAGLGLGFTF